METIQQLMVAMTFSDGNAAISPKCWHRDRAGCRHLSPGSIDSHKLLQLGRSHCRNCRIRAVRTAGLRFGRCPKVLVWSAGAAAWSIQDIPDIHAEVLSCQDFSWNWMLCA